MTPNLELFTTTLKMLAALAVVLGGMFVTFYFMKRFLNQKAVKGRGKLIRILGNTYVGIKKSISLVEVPGSVLVIGITNDNITLLDKIEDEQTLTALKSLENGRGQESFFQSFSDLISKGTQPGKQ